MSLPARKPSRILIVCCALLLGACASYRPEPLASPASLLDTDTLIEPLPPRAHARLPAAPIALDAPLGELDLARIALAISPDLAAARAQIGVAHAQLYAAGILPDPQLSLAVERPTSIDVVNAISGSLALDLGALLTREPQQRAARAGAEQVNLDVAWSEWLAINQVRTLVRRSAYLQQQQALLTAAATRAQERLAVYRDNLQRGDARVDDVSLVQVAYLDAQDRAQSVGRSLVATRLQLNALVGVAPSVQLKLAPVAADTETGTLDAAALTRSALLARLDLQALRAGYLAQEARLQTSVRGSLPLPQLNLSRGRDTGAVWTSGLGLDFVLPLWNRNRGEIAVATATRAQLRAEYAARVHQVQADIAQLGADLTAVRSARRLLETELPALRSAEATLASASREGKVALVTFETVRAALLDKEVGLLTLRQAEAEGRVALDTAAGEFLWVQ